MTTNLKATELKAGMKFSFTPSGNIFTIKTITDKRIFWNTDLHVSNVNKLKTAGTSLRIFQEGLDDGTYVIL